MSEDIDMEFHNSCSLYLTPLILSATQIAKALGFQILWLFVQELINKKEGD